jgi:hypothetical protein
MKRNKQSKVVEVDEGLVIVRYATARDEIRPPKIEVLVNPKDEKHIEIISNPLHSEAVLWQPGACLVVRAMRPGKLLVEVVPLDDAGSTAATVKVEMLSQGENAEVRSASPAARRVVDIDRDSRPQSRVDLGRLKIVGHVAGIGDVAARSDEWVAGPSAPARIEGLSIVWPGKPEDLDIRYCVRLARPHAVCGDQARAIRSGGFGLSADLGGGFSRRADRTNQRKTDRNVRTHGKGAIGRLPSSSRRDRQPVAAGTCARNDGTIAGTGACLSFTRD